MPNSHKKYTKKKSRLKTRTYRHKKHKKHNDATKHHRRTRRRHRKSRNKAGFSFLKRLSLRRASRLASRSKKNYDKMKREKQTYYQGNNQAGKHIVSDNISNDNEGRSSDFPTPQFVTPPSVASSSPRPSPKPDSREGTHVWRKRRKQEEGRGTGIEFGEFEPVVRQKNPGYVRNKWDDMS